MTPTERRPLAALDELRAMLRADRRRNVFVDLLARAEDELRVKHRAQAAAEIRAQHRAVYDDAGQRVAEGLLRAAQLIHPEETDRA